MILGYGAREQQFAGDCAGRIAACICRVFVPYTNNLHTLGAEVPKVWGAPPVGGAVGPLGRRKLFV
jgi:hypothetical protein